MSAPSSTSALPSAASPAVASIASQAGPYSSSSMSPQPPSQSTHDRTATSISPALASGPGATAITTAPNSSFTSSATHSSLSKQSAHSTASPTAPMTTKKSMGRDKDTYNQLLVERYLSHDALHQAALHSAQLQMQDEFRQLHMYADDYHKLRSEYRQSFPPRRIYGEGYVGLGNGYTEVNGPSRILYPIQKMRPGKRTTPPLKYSRKDMAQQAERYEELVPIRIDVEWDKFKLRDTFTWNLHDRLVPLELFTTQLLEDLGLKLPLSNQVYEQVCQQIQEQLCDFYPLVISDDDALDPELPYAAYKNDEMRILIKLNITIGQHTLVDQFEWDINNSLNSPEEFAASMARELSLSGEFTTAIAHCIREQTQLFARGLYSVGHAFDGRPIEDPDLVSAFLPSPMPVVFRPLQAAKEYAPYLYELSEAELERNELTFSREQRRQKRSVNRRGGPILPDLKDRQRTIRTLIVSSVLPGAATDVEDSRLYKHAPGPVVGRRRGGRDGDSDSDDSDDSSPDSPSVLQLAGTARTRGIRGAASAAQQRMANIGRSETPEASSTNHHYEPRLGRRATRDPREDSVDDVAPQASPRVIVTVKVNKDRLKKLLRNIHTQQLTGGGYAGAHASAPSEGSQTPSTSHQPLQTPGTGTQQLPRSASNSMGPPPTTPSHRNALAPTRAPHGHLGRLPAPPPPVSEVDAPPAPPPPQWLLDALQRLRDRSYPHDSFDGVMRYSVFNKDEQLVPAPHANEPMENYRFWYLPRIRCHDCPGKLYTPGPETTVGNFEVHLKNRFHREKVELRLARDAAKATSGSAVALANSATIPMPMGAGGFGSRHASEAASRESRMPFSGSSSQSSSPGAQ
ncbi:SWI/SNF chromatin-remodeling complex subunit [Sporothrix epigloea]|uniref:SWI/SNF chromatin-remodeling complex subunit n=1 Tax=Sporothrix epigloea TaxID=1892477 RepID=A0ABP0DI38_9PEZI